MQYRSFHWEASSVKKITDVMITLSDIILLLKKILIGIIITLIPFLILFGGLWLTQKMLSKNNTQTLSEPPK